MSSVQIQAQVSIYSVLDPLFVEIEAAFNDLVRQACPGRALAGFEIKHIMIYSLVICDFELEDHIGERPVDVIIKTQMIPIHNEKFLLRRREKGLDVTVATEGICFQR